MYKQLSITYDYFGILNCVCVILFCLFHSLLRVFCRTLADIPSGNWGGCLSETILTDFFCVPEAIFKGFSLPPNTVIESDRRSPRHPDQPDVSSRDNFKKMAKRSGRTSWKLANGQDWIRRKLFVLARVDRTQLGRDFVNYLYLRDFSNLQIVPYKYFCRFSDYTYPITEFAVNLSLDS